MQGPPVLDVFERDEVTGRWRRAGLMRSAKILVASHGEIAASVMRTPRGMASATVAA